VLPGDSSLQLATTEFIHNALSGVSTAKYHFIATEGQSVFDAGVALVDPISTHSQ
jgi:hypothetical protein